MAATVIAGSFAFVTSVAVVAVVAVAAAVAGLAAETEDCPG